MLELIQVTKNYNTKNVVTNALKNVSIEFRNNEFVSVLGPSGCGKTTMLNIIGGLDKYTYGNIIFNGKTTRYFDQSDWDDYRNRTIGFVFQSYNLIPHLTVLSNVEIALSLAGISKKKRRIKAKLALEKVGLGEYYMRHPNELSGGQMQRVSIARALVSDPDIILADEPTGALDSSTSVQVMEILKEISKEKLVIMVTHNSELADEYSDRILSLFDGSIIGDTKPLNKKERLCLDELRETAQNEENALKVLKRRLKHDFIFEKKISKSTFKNLKQIDKQKVAADIDSSVAAETPSSDYIQKRKKELKKTKRLHWFRNLHPLFSITGLSVKNMFSKKVRTSMLMLAGSIGIVGIALVLSVYNGFSSFMSGMEKNTLACFPLTISQTSVDLNLNLSENPYTNQPTGNFPNKELIYPNNESSNAGLISYHTNYITQQYLDYIENMKGHNPQWFASLYYERRLQMNLITKDTNLSSHNQKLMKITPSSSFFGWWQELLNLPFVQQNYDVIDGRMPKNKNEMLLIVDQSNCIPNSVLAKFGINVEMKNGKYLPIKFDKIIGDKGKKFKLIKNNDFYIEKNNECDTYKDEAPKLFEEIESQSELDNAYQNAQDELSLVGVIRLKKGKAFKIFSPGIGFMPELANDFLKDAEKSNFAVAQKKTYVDLLSNGGIKFDFNFAIFDQLIASENFKFEDLANYYYDKHIISEESYNNLKTNFSLGKLYNAVVENKHPSDTRKAIDVMLAPLENFGYSPSFVKTLLNSKYTNQLRAIGADSMPTLINIYASSFDAKTAIKKQLDQYNKLGGKLNSQKIKYTDMAASVTSTVNQIIRLTSYILITFATISLIVSSIMIYIITYISVVERTKEIGILRSMGASKFHIAHMFNSETFLIGTISGVLGIIIASILNYPINLLIQKYVGTYAKSISHLRVDHALYLILLSIIITVLSGVVPSIRAAYKDPVKSLRKVF